MTAKRDELPWKWLLLAGAAFVVGHFTGGTNPKADRDVSYGSGQRQGFMQSTSQAVYYENCTEAREAGVTPIREGEPGYAPHLDRDGDGIACE